MKIMYCELVTNVHRIARISHNTLTGSLREVVEVGKDARGRRRALLTLNVVGYGECLHKEAHAVCGIVVTHLREWMGIGLITW